MATTLVDTVIHWRKKLDKDPDDDTILNVIRKLSKVPMTLDILQLTHMGKKIRYLSKRDDIVGEKAHAVLKKWRDAFAAEASKNSKISSTSKKENRASAKHDATKEKTIHHKDSQHEHKYQHDHSSLSNNLSKQSAKQLINNCDKNNSIDSRSSIYMYEKKEMKKKNIDYDPLTNVSEGYNPECPELFFPDKSIKCKSDSANLLQTKISKKHKLITEEHTENESKSKKLKTTSFAKSDSLNGSESKKSGERKDKQSSVKDKSKSSDKSKSVEHNDKDKSKSGDKSKSVEHNDKKKSTVSNLKNKASNEKKDAKGNKSKPKLKLNCSEEFTSSEVRFEDCLGFNDIVTLKKKKSPKSQLPAKKIVNTSNNLPVQKTERLVCSSDSFKEKLAVPKPPVKLDVVDIMATLPETQPNYRPLPRSLDFYSPKKKEVMTNEDAIRFMSSRKEKTAVYSGRKGGRGFFAEVPSLFECCTRVLIDNIDAIEYMGEVPYFLLKPVLERCTPSQLFYIENYNPNLLESTNELWEIHCKRDYKLLRPEENETWRDLYWRAYDEREKKLKSVTANISAAMSKSTPVRQAKLAFVDSIAKPPRDVARRQAKNGTARPVNTVVKAGPPSKATPRPPAPIASTSTTIPFVPKKPKVAPLMAKSLKSLKQCFRR